MRRSSPDAACSGLPFIPQDTTAGRVFVLLPGWRAAVMVIDVACGPMAYKT